MSLSAFLGDDEVGDDRVSRLVVLRRCSFAVSNFAMERPLSPRMRARRTGIEAATMVIAPSAPPQMVTATVSAG
jgi:hypothetical protein